VLYYSSSTKDVLGYPLSDQHAWESFFLFSVLVLKAAVSELFVRTFERKVVIFCLIKQVVRISCVNE
jgi:hypothetical protein